MLAAPDCSLVARGFPCGSLPGLDGLRLLRERASPASPVFVVPAGSITTIDLFVVRARTVLDAARDDEQLFLVQLDVSITEPDS